MQENQTTQTPKSMSPAAPVTTEKPPRSTFLLSSSPHIAKGEDVPQIMRSVIYALLPAAIFGIYIFGWRVLIMMVVGVLAAILTEAITNWGMKKPQTISDGSAAVTGLLLVLTLPPSLPYWMIIVGAVVAIFIGKQIFGGLGYNIFNPALLGRAFLQASFPIPMTTWTIPKTIDAITTATPLGSFKFEKTLTPYFDLFMGNVGGCVGETSALLIMVGGFFLIIKKYADWRIPISYLLSVVVFGGVFWLLDPARYPDPVFHLFSGGLMLGAFFMATDMVTSPITPKGRWIFGIGAGIFLVVIRLFGGLPEGVMYSILLMNAFTPLINRYTKPQFFGEVKNV
jgi:electron transport complex protein RnfD